MISRNFFRSLLYSILASTLCVNFLACSARPKEAKKPNILFIVVDTLAVQHLGAYNSKQTNSPHIDALAKNGAVFERTYSAAPWTKPSITSLFTSLYPSQHGVRDVHASFAHSLTSLPEILKNSGYATKGLVSHTLIAPGKGFGQGFDAYDIVPFTGNVHDSVTSRTVSDMAIDWLQTYKTQASTQEKPFFLYLHYFDAHFNYQHHAQYDRSSWYKGKLTPGVGFRTLRKMIPTLKEEDYKYLRDLYDEEIAYTDEHIGRVFEAFKSLGLEKDTIVVLTADHGESFGERGSMGHTETLYDELVHIPLIFSWPEKITAKRLSETVGNIDVMPSLLDLLGISAQEANWQGKSFAKALLGRGRVETGRTLFSEVDFHSENIRAYFLGAFRDQWKCIHNKKTNLDEIYDIQSDPKEKKNLLGQNSRLDDELRAELMRFGKEIAPNGEKLQKRNGKEGGKVEQSPEEVEQLKSLGYL